MMSCAALLPVIALATTTMACQHGTPAGLADPAFLGDSVVAIRNVTVIPMEPAGSWPGQTVVIQGGVIVAVGPMASTPVPAGAAVLEGGGRYLIPGLIDAHVHMRRDDAPAYLRAGILTVRNMWGHSGIRPLVADIAAGLVAGPDIISTSPGLDGSPPQWPETQLVDDPALADSIVAAQAAAGWQTLKVYQQLSAASFDAIAAAARRRGLRIVGHVPSRVPILDALAAGIFTIEHLTGYDRAVSRTGRTGTWGWSDADSTRFAALAAATARAGTWNCPTLAIYRQLAAQHPADEQVRIVALRRGFVAALRAAGAPVVAGTDAGIGVVPPGTSLADELRELEAAGFSRREALRAATSESARMLGRSDLGRIAVGAAAELVLLPSNPLDDLHALDHVAGIVRHGRWMAVDSIVGLADLRQGGS